VDEGKVGAGQRAGAGATNATTDRFGRVLVTDTRGGALLAFTTGPIMLKQRYPVPGAPYGIAYDPKRDLAWVTLTERNEVVGYQVAGGEPKERYRFPTVVQPNSVTVDPDSGRVFVASATGGGVQVMQP
jgi:DNA-binding beta-propeller fold protein YncE